MGTSLLPYRRCTLARQRIAVLGLYNSGSTALAGMLHRLGVHMGPPFWKLNDHASPLNFYEPGDLSAQIRRWWKEPVLEELQPSQTRVLHLKQWVSMRERTTEAPVGAKHPLLSLCGPDLVRAWGPGTRFVWSWRPLDESVNGLKRRGWYRGHEEKLQETLWNAIHSFAAARPVLKLEWNRVKQDPLGAARELADLAGLDPEPSRIEKAAAFVRTEA